MLPALKIEEVQGGLERFAKQHFGVDASTMSEGKLDEAIATLRAQLAEKLAIRSDGNGLAMFVPTFEQVRSWHAMFPHIQFKTLLEVPERAQMTVQVSAMPIIAFIGHAMSRTDLPTAVYQTQPTYAYKVHFGPSVFFLENIRSNTDLSLSNIVRDEALNWISNNIGSIGDGLPELPYVVNNNDFSANFCGSHPHSQDNASNNITHLCVGNNRFRDYLFGQAPMKNIVDMNSFMVLMNHWCQGANLSDMYGRPASAFLQQKPGYQELDATSPEGLGWHEVSTRLVRDTSTLLETLAPLVQRLRSAVQEWQYTGTDRTQMSTEHTQMLSECLAFVRASPCYSFIQDTLQTESWWLGNKEIRVIAMHDKTRERSTLPLTINRGGARFLYLPGLGLVRGLRMVFDSVSQYTQACEGISSMLDLGSMFLEGVCGQLMMVQQKAYGCWMSLNSRRLSTDYRNIHSVGHMTHSAFFQNALRVDATISSRSDRSAAVLYWATPDMGAYAAMPKNWERLAVASEGTPTIPSYITALV